MAYSLVTGAAACGVNRTTILRAIKAGKISAERDAQGAWQIEPCELHRVFKPVAAGDTNVSTAQLHSPDAEVALLRTMLEEMRSTIADLRRREDDLKADRDHWREAHSASLRLLPAPVAEVAPAVHKSRVGFWRWVAGG